MGSYAIANYLDEKKVPLITNETFEAAQHARRQNFASRGRKGNDLANVFSGLATCAYCESEVIFHRNAEFRFLVCSKVLNEGECSRTAWTYRDSEITVFAFLAHPRS
jgi:hypothetical protein